MTLSVHRHLEESDQLRYVDGELDESAQEIADRHLAHCAACRDAVDDLAAASDGLTAFLNQTDYATRTLAYPGARAGGGWAGPWAIAAAIVALLGVGVVPASWMLFRHGDARSLHEPVLPTGHRPDVVDLAPVIASGGAVAVIPGDEPVAVIADEAVPVVPDRAGVFAIEVTSWQAGGALTLVFTDSDVFSSFSSNDRVTTTINTQHGIMVINTTANSESNHEVYIPHHRATQIAVRVAGQSIPLSLPDVNHPSDRIGQRVTIDLDAAARDRRRAREHR